MRSLESKGTGRHARLLAALLCSFFFGCTTSSVAAIENAAATERLAKAQALFAERCKTAGEKIYRTVDNVEGVFLLKLRPEEINYGDQFKLDDPYGHDSGGDTYILNFLHGFYHQGNGVPTAGAPAMLGYSYVEAVDPRDGQRYRYSGRVEEPWQTNKSYLKGYTRFVMDRVKASGPTPRYGVTYDDISTREEREFWIAGSSLKVIDLQTNEIIGERIGYMIDASQGSRSGGRSPWFFAADHACPGFQFNPLRPLKRSQGGGGAAQQGQTLVFVEKVLKPIGEIEE